MARLSPEDSAENLYHIDSIPSLELDRKNRLLRDFPHIKLPISPQELPSGHDRYHLHLDDVL